MIQNSSFLVSYQGDFNGNGAVMALNPSIYTANKIGEAFTINITAADVTNLWSWKAEVSLDPAVPSLVGNPTEDPFLKSVGQTLFVATPSQKGTITEISCTILAIAGATGSGVISTLTFTINKETAGSPITLSNTVFLGPLTGGDYPNIDHQVQNATAKLIMSGTFQILESKL